MQEAVVITGGAMNIGRAIADRAAADGYTPIILDIAEPDGPADGLEFRKVDLADQNGVEAALNEVVETFNPTRLVNNVGVVKPEALEELDFASFETVDEPQCPARDPVRQGASARHAPRRLRPRSEHREPHCSR